ncbi:MAG: CsgG/HfaB family protein [Treponema sp.]|nr:CsgG/HfaB family protein [Treponema sp.]
MLNFVSQEVEELWNHFDTSGTFVMVDRQNLEKIQAEMNYQMSGEVSDESALSIGQQFGVQTKDGVLITSTAPFGLNLTCKIFNH